MYGFALAIALVLASSVGIAAALSGNIVNQATGEDEIRAAHIAGSTVTNVSIENANIENSVVRAAGVRSVSINGSYLDHVAIHDASIEDSRVASGSIARSSLSDVTICRTDVENGRDAGVRCRLVDGRESLARLWTDAPAMIAPGGSYDLRLSDVEASTLVVRNDPAGSTALGFDPTAADATIDRIELWQDDAMVQAFELGDAVSIPDEDFTLRVYVAQTGIVDGSTLGLVLDLDGHGLRPAMTTLDVVATSLGFAPADAQPFAPFLADNVARLVVSVATDDFGNVDRDLDVAYTVDVANVDSGAGLGGPTLGEPIDEHSYLHGDSELFSAEPFKYVNPRSEMSHHPATLELILRDTVGVPGIVYGSAPFYATHVVAQSPYHTELTLHATTVNAAGQQLDAAPLELRYTHAPEAGSPVAHPFGPFGGEMFPGLGTLRVHFMDKDGNSIDREPGWVLFIQETPESHQTEMRIVYTEDDAGPVDEQKLAASPAVGLPFGDFFPHEYKVCLEYDGKQSCWNDGELVNIRTGETTTIHLVVS